MAGSDGSRSGRLINGETNAILREEGNLPSVKDKLASRQIMSEKVSEQDLIKEVGMKSN